MLACESLFIFFWGHSGTTFKYISSKSNKFILGNRLEYYRFPTPGFTHYCDLSFRCQVHFEKYYTYYPVRRAGIESRLCYRVQRAAAYSANKRGNRAVIRIDDCCVWWCHPDGRTHQLTSDNRQYCCSGWYLPHYQAFNCKIMN